MSIKPVSLASYNTYNRDRSAALTDATKETSRDVRRQLAACVRNDWDYPSLPEHRAPTPRPLDLRTTDGAADTTQTDTAVSTSHNQTADSLPFEPIGWRERGYSSSDSIISDQSAEEGDSASKATNTHYLFDSPDTVAQTVAGRRENRKRKRSQVHEEEMAWNNGLAHYVARRNAWTYARLASATQATPAMHDQAPLHEPDNATSRNWLPLPERLLQGHPVRAKITPAAYSDIYSKIIVQSRVPTVPINLSDITKSCVRGWIAEGNWPPKPGAVDPLVGHSKKTAERHPHLRKGVQAVGRVFGLSTSEDSKKR